MGIGGQQLQAWAFGDDDNELLAASQARTGANIAGRKTHDSSMSWWGADGPGGAARTPTFIAFHTGPDDRRRVYTFVGSPLEALESAQTAAGNRTVDVFNPSIGNQLLAAGAVHEIHLYVAPVLLVPGHRCFRRFPATCNSNHSLYGRRY
jgi:dihydrofolate reductase